MQIDAQLIYISIFSGYVKGVSLICQQKVFGKGTFYIKNGYLTIIPRARLSSESIAIDSEAMRTRGIIVLVKSNYSWSKISRQNNCSQQNLIHPPLFCIQPSSSSTNQNAALIIDHQLDFERRGRAFPNKTSWSTFWVCIFSFSLFKKSTSCSNCT